jgi:hypothetical protein
MVNKAVINAPGTTWAAVVTSIVTRFHPDDFLKQLNHHLCHPAIKKGEGIKAYDECYRGIHA